MSLSSLKEQKENEDVQPLSTTAKVNKDERRAVSPEAGRDENDAAHL